MSKPDMGTVLMYLFGGIYVFVLGTAAVSSIMENITFGLVQVFGALALLAMVLYFITEYDHLSTKFGRYHLEKYTWSRIFKGVFIYIAIVWGVALLLGNFIRTVERDQNIRNAQYDASKN